jgi:hypothetical protein
MGVAVLKADTRRSGARAQRSRIMPPRPATSRVSRKRSAPFVDPEAKIPPKVMARQSKSERVMRPNHCIKQRYA